MKGLLKFVYLLLPSVLNLCELICCDCVWNNGLDRIDCDLRILDFRRNSSDVPSEASQVKSLNVDCSHVFFFESQLRSDHFGDLPHLKHLQINFCKIRHLPPRSFVSLVRLESLSIHTHNADWTSLSLQPDYESLVGLDLLQTLDLSINNLQRFPPGLLCPLTQIKTVNASYNNVTDLEDLGFSARTEFKCDIPVKSLIVRESGLKSVMSGSLSSLTKLEELDLSTNYLNVLAENAFKDLIHLKILDLSHNSLAALPPKIFTPLSKLENLQIANNTLGTIDLNVFNNCTHLKLLNLSGNSLDENWIKPGIFKGLSELLVLDLNSNHLREIDPHLFVDLKSLQVLNLEHNQILSISSNTFSTNSKLQILMLSNNQLETLSHQTLDGLSILQSLFLDHNKIHSVMKSTFEFCATTLQELKINNNFLTEVPEPLHHLKALKRLDLSSNVIGVLKRESLQGLPNLITLRIANNELSRIGEGSFTETPELRHLDLSKNRFKVLDQETFRTLQNLQSLNLAENLLDDINGVLTTQITLRWLNMSSNNLGWFDYAFIPPSLEWLDIHNNLIDSLGNYYSLKYDYALKYMDASYNKIRALDPLSVLPSIRDLYLNNNAISKISESTFLSKTNLSRVHLNHNEITTLEMMSLIISPNEILKESPMFYLSNNPLICNCHLQWFKQINTRTNHYPQIMDMDKISCSVQRNSHYAVLLPISKVQNDEFLCVYESHCFSLCMCCDFFACDCQMKCPDNCQCFHDSTWSSNIIQCSAQDLTDTPPLIPMDATSLLLDGNNFTELTNSMFLGRTRLKKLYLNNSRIRTIRNQSFEGLSHLIILDLGRNELKRLYGFEFNGLKLLQELHLSGNQLVSIHQDTFKEMSQLEVLKLDGNLLISFPIWTLSSNSRLNELSLAHNWWQCDCDFVRKFRMFIDGNSDIIKDAGSITCTTSVEATNDENCSEMLTNNVNILKNTHSPFLSVILSVSLLSISLVLVIILFYRLKDEIRIWLHYKYGIRFCSKTSRHMRNNNNNSGNRGDPSKIYFDGIILYSLKDSLFIQEDMGKKIETTYKVIYHHKDLSGIYTSEGFKSSLKASANHLVILSRSFIDTEWEHVKLLSLHNVIIVIIEDFEIPSDIKSFLKASKKVLKWSNDIKFWRRFRYYMTDPIMPTTKEGGAELDKSGVWTFASPNVTATSHYSDVTNGLMDSSTTPMLMNLLNGSNFNTPLKKPHTCHSSHSLALSSSGSQSNIKTLQPSLTTSGLVACASPINRRSCGINAVVHQRSMSAAQQPSSEYSEIHHQRSLSHHTQIPPTPPPKVSNRGSIYNQIQSQTSFINQLMTSQGHPADILHQRRQLHQRSTSLLSDNIYDPSASRHVRSSSTLAPPPPPMNVERIYQRGQVAMGATPVMKKIQHSSLSSSFKSAHNLNHSMPTTTTTSNNIHIRSTSTPHDPSQGFVL